MKASRVRITVQLAFLFFITWVGIRHQMLGGGPEGAPSVDALCPFGGLESLHMYLSSGGWLRRIAPSSFVLLVTVVIMTVVSGRTFCGWVCPLGTLGELSAKLGNRLGIKKTELPTKLDYGLRYLKYAVLLIIITLTWRTGTLVWRNYDPWMAYMHLSAGFSEMVEKPWAFVVLFGTVIAASLSIERFWCRYLCPLGALLAPLQKISPIKVKRSEEDCIHCHLCTSACPVRLAPEATDKVTSAECLSCGRCVDKCPKDKALFFGAGRIRVKALTVGIIGLAIFFGGYGYAKWTGYWRTWASPSNITISRDPTEAIFGWMTVNQISETLGITVKDVIHMGKLPENIAVDIPVKEIEGVDDEVLKDNLRAALDTAPSAMPAPPPVPDEIRGSMTVREIAETYGLDGKQILEKAGWPTDSDQGTEAKALAQSLGLEVQTLRDAVKELLRDR